MSKSADSLSRGLRWTAHRSGYVKRVYVMVRLRSWRRFVKEDQFYITFWDGPCAASVHHANRSTQRRDHLRTWWILNRWSSFTSRRHPYTTWIYGLHVTLRNSSHDLRALDARRPYIFFYYIRVLSVLSPFLADRTATVWSAIGISLLSVRPSVRPSVCL